VWGDPEYAVWPDDEDALIKEEVEIYFASRPPEGKGE